MPGLHDRSQYLTPVAMVLILLLVLGPRACRAVRPPSATPRAVASP